MGSRIPGGSPHSRDPARQLAGRDDESRKGVTCSCIRRFLRPDESFQSRYEGAVLHSTAQAINIIRLSYLQPVRLYKFFPNEHMIALRVSQLGTYRRWLDQCTAWYLARLTSSRAAACHGDVPYRYTLLFRFGGKVKAGHTWKSCSTQSKSTSPTEY